MAWHLGMLSGHALAIGQSAKILKSSKRLTFQAQAETMLNQSEFASDDFEFSNPHEDTHLHRGGSSTDHVAAFLWPLCLPLNKPEFFLGQKLYTSKHRTPFVAAIRAVQKLLFQALQPLAKNRDSSAREIAATLFALVENCKHKSSNEAFESEVEPCSNPDLWSEPKAARSHLFSALGLPREILQTLSHTPLERANAHRSWYVHETASNSKSATLKTLAYALGATSGRTLFLSFTPRFLSCRFRHSIKSFIK